MAEKRSPHSIEAIAVGTLVALELKTTKPKEEGKKAFTFLQAEIAAAGSKLRVTVWPSQKRPSLPQDLSEQLAIGQKVSARGSLEEQVGEDQRLYRGLRAWTVAPSDAHDEDKLVYHVAGHMGRLEKTGAGEHVVPITCVRHYTNRDNVTVDQESTVRVCPSEQLIALLYQQVPVGRVIRARGDIINKTQIDRFGLPSGEFVSQLDVALLELWDDQKEIWLPLKAGTPLPPAEPARPSATGPGPATVPTPPADDDDIPF